MPVHQLFAKVRTEMQARRQPFGREQPHRSVVVLDPASWNNCNSCGCSTKLDALELFPLFLHYLTTVDPRQSVQRYKETMVVVLTDLKEKRQRLADRFGDGFALPDLDALKQHGFYSHHEGARCISNEQGVSLETAQAVVDLAWRAIDALRFVLKHSLEAYRASFVSLRSKIDSQALLQIRERAQRIVEDVFDYK